HQPDLGHGHAKWDDVDRPTDHRQMRDGVGLGKIVHPEKWRIPKFNGLAEHFEQPEEDRDLNHHRQTAAHRINSVILVELHHFLVHPRRDVFIFVAQLLDLRVEQRHLPHRAIGFTLQRPEDNFDDGGERENGSAVGTDPTMEQVQEVEQELADYLEDAEI